MLLGLLILDPDCFGPNKMKPLTKAFWFTKFFVTFLKFFVSAMHGNHKEVSQKDENQYTMYMFRESDKLHANF